MSPDHIEPSVRIEHAEYGSRVIGLSPRLVADASSTTFALEIGPELAELGLVRRLVASIVCRGERETDALFLVAVTEVVTNAIEAHQRAGLADPIVITVDAEAPIVEVADTGDGLEANDLDGTIEADEPGWGLALARDLVPGLSWGSNVPRGTIVSLPYATASSPDDEDV